MSFVRCPTVEKYSTFDVLHSTLKIEHRTSNVEHKGSPAKPGSDLECAWAAGAEDLPDAAARLTEAGVV